MHAGYGPRKVMAGILVLGAIPSGLAGTISSANGLYVVRFFIGTYLHHLGVCHHGDATRATFPTVCQVSSGEPSCPAKRGLPHSLTRMSSDGRTRLLAGGATRVAGSHSSSCSPCTMPSYGMVSRSTSRGEVCPSHACQCDHFAFDFSPSFLLTSPSALFLHLSSMLSLASIHQLPITRPS